MFWAGKQYGLKVGKSKDWKFFFPENLGTTILYCSPIGNSKPIHTWSSLWVLTSSFAQASETLTVLLFRAFCTVTCVIKMFLIKINILHYFVILLRKISLKCCQFPVFFKLMTTRNRMWWWRYKITTGIFDGQYQH